MHKYFNGFNLIQSLTYGKFHALFSYNNDLEKVWHCLNCNLLKKLGVELERVNEIMSEITKINVDDEYKKIISLGINTVTINEPTYPKLLKQIHKPPLILYYKGDISILNNSINIAVVGTRKCSLYGEFAVKNIVGKLVLNGFCIVSGLAKGIDTLAHKITVNGNGKTAAVLGSSLDLIYPFTNRNLAKEIEKNGVVLSEFPLGTSPNGYNFPRRNRIISGLSKGTLVIEAPERSGALITASFAVSQNREVFAIPGDINKGNSKGTNLLIQKGEAFPVLKVDDIYNAFELSVKDNIETKIQLSPEEKAVVDLIQKGVNEINQLIVNSEYDMSVTLKIISMLEIRGIIKQCNGRISLLF